PERAAGHVGAGHRVLPSASVVPRRWAHRLRPIRSVQHGRDHDERRQKHREEPKRENRASNTPPDPEEEAVRFGLQHGAETAPTERAVRREAERHRLEREMGHHAAGTGGYQSQTEFDELSREQLEEAARRADEAVKR